LAVVISVTLVFAITSWNIVPTSVTEDVTVIAVTNYGCVGESDIERSVVVPNCSAVVGDTISAIFNIPVMEINGYYDTIGDKLEMINP